MKIKKKNVGQIVLNLVFILLMVCYIVPVLTLISGAFTDETALIQNGYSIIPSEFSLESMAMALQNPMKILKSYAVTIFVTVVSTLLFLVLSALMAYPMSRMNFIWRKQVNFLVVFTMLFQAGMVPTYLLICNVLKVENTVWSLILPGLINAYYVIVIRTGYSSIPGELVEAAKIEGASELFICWKIMIPLNKASLASVAFLFFVERWNNWEHSMLYIRNPDLYTLQYLLQKMLREAEQLKQAIDPSILQDMSVIPSETLRFAMALLAAGPVLLVFPFFQKYFTKGMTIGGVKG